jgi:guanine deaminase
MMPLPATPRAFLAHALHAPSRGQIEYLPDALIVAGAGGRIEAIHAAASDEAAALAARHRAAGTLVTFPPGHYLLPGFVDLHVHAPQWPQLGLALDLPLEDWLQTCTFPLEARYADLSYAETAYESLVDSLLANGTTTALYFASIHLAATQKLADICLRRSQRALIGRVAMDNPEQCPDFYRDPSAAAAEADTRAFIHYVRTLHGNADGLILPVITPRFIPSCTDDLLSRLGELVGETGCHVQTHCSESDWAHAFVLARYGITDTQALARFGLLSRRTILAHGNFIGDSDVATILAHGCGIAHCPLSNVYFSDAVFPLRRMLERGVHVGLGTDIAGGASPSILENARHAVIQSRSLESGVDPTVSRAQRRSPDSRIDASTAFWLATAGGGQALDLAVGLFRVGYQFDAVVIDANARGGNLRLDAGAAPDEILQKIVYHGARANVRETWVANRLVHSRDSEFPQPA